MMSPTQLFHVPTALKRSRSKAVNQQKWQPDRRETKAEHILGVSEADINTARNQSISSSATNRLQGTLSDTTTEFGTSLLLEDKVPQLPELRLKASSVLLHEECYQDPTSAISNHSGRLKTYDSSSTLHSHYDPQQAPLAVSQQTSDSSRRDFALRKGTPVVVRPNTQESDSMRQMMLPMSSKTRPQHDSKKLSKDRPRTGTTVSKTSAKSSRPTTRKADAADFIIPSIPTKTFNHVRFSPHSTNIASPRPSKTLLEPLDPACVKVNIRRPKVGAKYWFDGLEGDSSGEESIDEPAFDETFVNGVESAFQSGRIKPPSDTSTITTTAMDSSLSSSSTPKSFAFRFVKTEPPVVPRIAVLNAKASRSSLKPLPSKRTPAKRKPDSLAKNNLKTTSVLNLSSSDDEDKPITPQRADSAVSGPALRDSVAMAFNNTSQVELGTAEAISAMPSGPDQTQVRKLKVVSQQQKRGQLHMPIPKRTSGRVLMQMTDVTEANDLIASFPPTPVDSIHSHRTSIRSSMAISETDSVESRRYMSVTKEEESLLAAMRLKKAAMKYNTMHNNRLETLRNLERGQSRQPQSTNDSNRGFVSASQLIIDTRPVTHSHRRSLSNDDRIQSGTTFQTTTTRHPSRRSRLTLHSELSPDNVTRLSLSSEASDDASISPSLLSLSTADRRESRDTFFSSASPAHRAHVRRPTATSHVVALDELDKIPKRDEIPSQEFIDWPYDGWEARSKLGLAH